MVNHARMLSGIGTGKETRIQLQVLDAICMHPAICLQSNGGYTRAVARHFILNTRSCCHSRHVRNVMIRLGMGASYCDIVIMHLGISMEVKNHIQNGFQYRSIIPPLIQLRTRTLDIDVCASSLGTTRAIILRP